jgi:hypothetical protein
VGPRASLDIVVKIKKSLHPHVLKGYINTIVNSQLSRLKNEAEGMKNKKHELKIMYVSRNIDRGLISSFYVQYIPIKNRT